jgi:hypothetical protein
LQQLSEKKIIVIPAKKAESATYAVRSIKTWCLAWRLAQKHGAYVSEHTCIRLEY